MLSIHRGYVAIELLMAIVVLGLGFNLFYKIYEQRLRDNIFNQSTIYQAQDLMEKTILLKTNTSNFSIESKNGHIYSGFLIQTPDDMVGYRYFSPDIILDQRNNVQQ
ncbi:hypothetical protein [Helicobacter sp. 13S00482-2]|uniref:hypothetical protein n=1 Tax=Helicobacter sp. 13S00482-2 TaxID=1476200 RepID=UPI00117B49A9|nr:hypothetical protein [Helicobacter sp. 13S00482-2]